MTEQEIRNMQVDRNFDMVIMNKVFKHKIIEKNDKYICECSDKNFVDLSLFNYIIDNNVYVVDLPNFSTNYADALKLITLLKIKGYHVSLNVMKNNYICVVEEGKSSIGKTESEAICKAVLILANKKGWSL